MTKKLVKIAAALLNEKELTARVKNLMRKTPDEMPEAMTLACTAAAMIGKHARETGHDLGTGLELVMTIMGEFAVRGYEGKFDA